MEETIKKQVSTSLSEEEKSKIEALAIKESRSVSNLIYSLIKERLDRENI